MNIRIITSLMLISALMAGCEDKNPGEIITNAQPETPVTEPGSTFEDNLPPSLSVHNYTESLHPTPYKPILVSYGRVSDNASVNWTNNNFTRILPLLIGFRPDYTTAGYTSKTNKWGSSTTLPVQEATGRFHTKKIGDRWWIIDPDGYVHYERSVTSLRQGPSTRNRTAWSATYGSVDKWLSDVADELAVLGFHGTGAFCTDTYIPIQTHNAANPEKPLTLTPSFGFLSQFRSRNGLTYPGGNSVNAVGLVLNDLWPQFCKDYINLALAPYLGDKNMLGFFSDNEIDFSSQNSRILDRFYTLADKTDKAYLFAKEFMDSKNATSVTDALNDEFAGLLAEKYYKGVKDAIREIDPGMMYLGSRLHGTPKYLKGVIAAAGRHCDIVSINYYSRWSPELTTWVADWAALADAPFLVTEFYTKAMDSGLPNTSGAGFGVKTEQDKAFAYQHFTLGLLEAKNCVGWHWFKYQDDDSDLTGADNTSANKGLYDNDYKLWPYLSEYMKRLNYNVYELVDHFDNH